MRNAFATLLAVIVSGCATNPPAQSIDWIGKSELELLSKFGAPDKSYETTSGLRVFSYDRQLDGIDQMTGHMRTYRCTITFMLEESVIISHEGAGPDCAE